MAPGPLRAGLCHGALALAAAAPANSSPNAASAATFGAVGPCQGDQRLDEAPQSTNATKTISASGLFSIT